MASIKERNGKYCLIYGYRDKTGKTKQKWETYSSKAEALKRKTEVEYKTQQGIFVVPQCKILKDLLAEYVSLYGKERWALKTYETNTGLINNYILPYIGNVKVSDINTRFLEKFYQDLQNKPAVIHPYLRCEEQKTVGPSRIRDVHRLLRSCRVGDCVFFHQEFGL